jgi:hypothetical protein
MILNQSPKQVNYIVLTAITQQKRHYVRGRCEETEKKCFQAGGAVRGKSSKVHRGGLAARRNATIQRTLTWNLYEDYYCQEVISKQ